MKRHILCLLILLSASGFMKAQVSTNGLRLWLRADSAVTTSVGGFVVQWNDLSPQANHATNVTPTSTPLLLQNALNGKPVIRFDGNDDVLRSMVGTQVGAGNRTLIMVYLRRSDAVNSGIFSLRSATGQDWNSLDAMAVTYSSTGQNVQLNLANDLFLAANDGLAQNNLMTLEVQRQATATIRINGANVASGTTVAATTANTAGYLIGARTATNGPGVSQHGDVDIAEILLYDRLLNSTERLTAETYLASKYSLPHPLLPMTASASGVTNLTSSSATLNGSVNPNSFALTSARFEISLDPNFSTLFQTINTTPNAAGIGNGTSPVNVSASISGLTAGQVYYYRIAVSSALGERRSNVRAFAAPLVSTGLARWFRADAFQPINTSNPTNVGRLFDLSGNNDAVQTVLANSPTIQNSNVDFGNKPVIRSFQNTWLDFPDVMTVRTVFIVARAVENRNGQCILGHITAADFHGGTNVFPDNQNRLISTLYSSPNVRNGALYYNGSAQDMSTANRPMTPTTITIQTLANTMASSLTRDRAQANRSWDGEIAEVLIYSDSLTTAQRQAVEQYLATRYSLPNNLLPILSLGSPSTVSNTTITLNGTINPNGATLTGAQFQISTDINFQQNVLTVNTLPSMVGASGYTNTSVSATFSGQFPSGTLYYYRLRANTATSSPSTPAKGLVIPVVSRGLGRWYRADVSTVVSGQITELTDLSGNNQPATQSDPNRRPNFATDPNFENQAVVSSFSNTHLQFGQMNNIRTVMMVVRTNAVGANGMCLLGDLSNFDFHGGTFDPGDDANLLISRNYASLNVRNGSLFYNSIPQTISSALRPINNTTIITILTRGNTTASTITQDRPSAFTTRSWAGQIAEIVLFSDSLNIAERLAMENYMKQRYGIGTVNVVSNPSVSANAFGTYILGNTGATVTFITPSSTAGSLSGSVTNSRPNVFGSLPTGITNLAERFWTINQTGLTGFSYALTLDLSTLSGVQNFANLKLLKRNNASSPWLDVETLPGVTITRNAPFITVAGLTSFSDFTIGSDASNQLPVELTEFTGRKSEQGVELAWRTASEQNNAGFEVQRRSENRGASTEWHALGFVRGNGTTTEAQSYSFLDRTAVGKVQYRLKQVDFDGQFEYSNIIEVDAGAPKVFALEQNYPNPFNPTTVISYQLPVASEVSLKVYDVLGREVMTLVNGRQEAGAYNFNFNASNLSSGVYFYRLQASATNGASSSNFVSTKKMMLVK